MTAIDRHWVAARVSDAAAREVPDPAASVDRLRELLARCAVNFTAIGPGDTPKEVVPPRRGLHPDEASAFLAAIDQHLAVVDDAGYVTVTCARPKTPPGRYALLSRGQAGPSVNLEYLIQIGAAAELTATYGWPSERVDFERGEFDLLGFGDDDRVLLAVEAKARVTGQDSLEKLLLAWLDYNDAGGEAPATNAGRKYIELRRLCESGPVLVWLVAAGARWSLTASRTEDALSFHEAPPPVYRRAEDVAVAGREVLWSRRFDRALHGRGTRGADGKCSWLCEESAIWSTRVRELSGSESTFALCDHHQGQVERVYCGA